MLLLINIICNTIKKKFGLVRDLNPGPLAPKARIIPLDQRADIHRKGKKSISTIAKLYTTWYCDEFQYIGGQWICIEWKYVLYLKKHQLVSICKLKIKLKDYIQAVFRELSLLSGHASYCRMASRLTPLTNRKHKDET